LRSSALDRIGAGALAHGGFDAPSPVLAPGTPLGQHLRIERVVRAVEGRHLYLATNVDPLWAHKKCWHCGNRYNPNQAQACSYCGTPLTEQRFVASVRHAVGRAPAWERWAQLRLRAPGLVDLVAAFYREHHPIAVFAHHGEQLLADQPAPMSSQQVLSIAVTLARALREIQGAGGLVGPFDASRVVLMPDGSARWFDLDIESVLPDARAPSSVALRDVGRLAAMLRPWVHPDDVEMIEHFEALASDPPSIDGMITSVESHRARLPVEPTVEVGAATLDVGLKRVNQEDHWAWRRVGPHARAAVVADGMGGMNDGEVAARLTCTTSLASLAETLSGKAPPDAQLQLAVSTALRRAHDAVRGAGRGQIGCTAALVVWTDDGRAAIGHAGDVRVYHQRGRALRQLTTDHTVAQAMVERGTLTAAEVRGHPKASVVLQHVGMEDDLEVDLQVIKVQPGDQLLLCSDGLWGPLPDAAIAEALGAPGDPREIATALCRGALNAGGRDNLSLVLIRVA
jgi:serine/threonine protein phosphatase PrpC